MGKSWKKCPPKASPRPLFNFGKLPQKALTCKKFFQKQDILKEDYQKALKIVSTTFLLVCFVCLKESTCETRKNVFNFTSKALFVLEIIKF